MPLLSPEIRNSLIDALHDAFPNLGTFDSFLRTQLNRERADIVVVDAGNIGYRDCIERVVRDAEGRRWLPKLINAALKVQSTNELIRQIHETVIKTTGSITGDHWDACVLFGDYPCVGRPTLRQYVKKLFDNKRTLTVAGEVNNSGRTFTSIFLSHFCALFDEIVYLMIDLEQYIGKPVNELMKEIARELNISYSEHFERGDTAGSWLAGQIRDGAGALRSENGHADRKSLWLCFDNCDSVGLLTEVTALLDYLAIKVMQLKNLRLILLAQQEPLPAQAQIVQVKPPEVLDQPLPDRMQPEVQKFLEQFARLNGKPFPDDVEAEAETQVLFGLIDEDKDFFPELHIAFEAWRQTYFPR